MKPATPLPWSCDTNPDDWGLVTETDLPNVEPIIFCGDRSNVPREQDLKYVAHACNLYPKLVEFVKGYGEKEHSLDCLERSGTVCSCDADACNARRKQLLAELAKEEK